MPDQIPIPIDGISDPDLIRVKLLASGKDVHAPLTALDAFYDVATVTHAAASKTTPVDADEIPLVDSAAGYTLKKLTWGNLKEGIRVFFYGANKVPVDADVFGMLDSATSFSPKYSTWAQIKAAMIAALGTAAVKNTGTSGNTVPLLNGANTWSAIQTFSALPSLTGGGLTFPATQVPSAGANDLDDYEEGTWTPVIFGTTAAGTATYTTQTARYTKIGNIVYFFARVIYNTHTGTGNMGMSGLPFTVNGSTPIMIRVSALTFPATLLQGLTANGTTTILFETVATGAVAASLAMDVAADVNVMGFYFV